MKKEKSKEKPARTRRLSLGRLGIVLVVTAGLIAGGTFWVKSSVEDLNSEPLDMWVAGYVDTTLTPLLHFEDPIEGVSSSVVLGFVVADPADSCAPSWGTYYSLDAASRALDLDRRIVRLRERGGDAVVSFGGAFNHELATTCKDVDTLVAAYQSVIDRYELTTVDFDIEGAALGDTAANERRSQAIKRLQEDNEGLRVWFTLPVAPHGMTAEGVALIDQLLASGVRFDGVNVMTMDYGGSRPPAMSMREATRLALEATWQQLDVSFREAGQELLEREVWGLIGATPMIGQNDVPEEVFTPQDAEWLTGFAREKRIGRLSYWSANRDIACGPGVADRRVSNTCSGVEQEARQFTDTFESAGSSQPRVTLESTPQDPGVDSATRGDEVAHDDPNTSPYPIWRAAKQYVAGDKVVWQRRVYEAKWWSEGAPPDAPVAQEWDSPWRYLGPVLEGDRVAVMAAAPESGERPRWNSESVYVAGDNVEHGNMAFKAKWWTQGDTPQADPDRPFDHPWEFVGYILQDGSTTKTKPQTASATPQVGAP